MDTPGLLQQLAYGLTPQGDPESFIVSPRRRLAASSTVVVIPANGSNTITTTLPFYETQTLEPFNVDDGVMFELLTGTIAPADTSGHLQIVDMALSLWSSISAAPFLPLAGPTATTLFPRVSTSLQFAPPPLLTMRDMQSFALSNILETNLQQRQPFRLILTVSLANNDAAPHSALVQFNAMYRKVSGLLGA